MTYEQFQRQASFEHEELIAFAYGRLVEDPPPGFDGRLPAPPFLMVDRVISMERDGRRGRIVAQQDVRLDAWFFQCHMAGDPVQPGCLCLDAVWQLLGFYGIWRGGLGAGRALGCGEVAFEGQIRPHDSRVLYVVEIRRFAELRTSGATLVIGDGEIYVDEKRVGYVREARTGLFPGIVYRDYPLRSPLSVGGEVRRT
ncbi:MAG TPA: bifunctional 3-hydroxydecanoyl-ACP dehydratase/trans-2-decenoyl-ACP isomerase [Syntrophales bacterium]|nr:bifunctional 3-hydroxydecanoyl-ACP dehydratase/trans-2-decenoyl-ACP isomerase [Syntrophales bacterium]